MKKFLTSLLCVMMIVAMMPAMAFAEEVVTEPVDGAQPETQVEEIAPVDNAEETVELPEVVITDITDSYATDPGAAEGYPLTFALNFAIKDMESLTDEYLEKLFAKYGKYYVDYVLTISGLAEEDGTVAFNSNGDADGYLAGQYNAWSENWVYVPLTDVVVNNNQSFYIMEYAADLMNKGGLRFTLEEIATIVVNFDCGVYFTPEFLKANPDMTVTLELKVFTEDAEGNKIENIDVATNVFTAKETFTASVTAGEKTEYFTTLTDALSAAEASETATTIEVLNDASYDNTNGTKVITPKSNITINGNGHEITTTTNRMFRFKGGDSPVEVTINDLDITSTVSGGRCIETRGANITLNLNDVNLVAENGAYTQPLTIGGNHADMITVNINGGTISAGTGGYGIITFNPVKMNITGANIGGYAALYFKAADNSAGSAGTRVTVSNSNISSNNVAPYHENNGFGTVVFCDGDIQVAFTNSTVTAATTENSQITIGTWDEAENTENIIVDADSATTFSDDAVKAYMPSTKEIRDNGNGTYSMITPTPDPDPYYPPVVIDPTPSTPQDTVTNESTNTGASGETVVAPTTNADVSASTTTTKTETGETKTETKVEQTVADQIVEKAVENKSEEVVIDATTAPTTGTTTTTPAEETKAAEVVIPTQTIETIAAETEAAVTVKTDVAEIKLDNTAATAIAEQAAEGGTISIVAVKTDEVVVEEETATGETKTVTEVHFELKVVCSENGVIGDFKGGEVTVTVPVPEDMHTEELVCVYIDAQGHYHKVTGVKNANGTFTFVTDHFSSYAVMTAAEAEAAIEAQKSVVEDEVVLKLRSANSKTSKGKKAIKLTVSEVTDTGIDFDGYVIYRSTKKNSGYKKIYTTKTGTYYNTSAKSGVKYYYKAKGFVTIDGEKVYTGWSKKAIRTAK